MFENCLHTLKPVKPRLKREFGLWVCIGNGCTGFGLTADQAYRSWRAQPLVYRPNYPIGIGHPHAPRPWWQEPHLTVSNGTGH